MSVSHLSNVMQAYELTLHPVFISLFALLSKYWRERKFQQTRVNHVTLAAVSLIIWKWEGETVKPQRIWNPYLNIETSDLSITANCKETDCLVTERSLFESMCQVKMPLCKTLNPFFLSQCQIFSVGASAKCKVVYFSSLFGRQQVGLQSVFFLSREAAAHRFKSKT